MCGGVPLLSPLPPTSLPLPPAHVLSQIVETTSLPTLRVLNRILLNRLRDDRRLRNALPLTLTKAIMKLKQPKRLGSEASLAEPTEQASQPQRRNAVNAGIQRRLNTNVYQVTCGLWFRESTPRVFAPLSESFD